MLDTQSRPQGHPGGFEGSRGFADRGEGGQGLDVSRLTALARRQGRLVAAGCVLGLALGAAYALTAVPRYTAGADLLIDNHQVRAVQDVSSSVPDNMALDASAVDSQIEVLKSEGIALAVVARLKLGEDPDFQNPPLSILGRVRAAAMSVVDLTRWIAPAVPADGGGVQAAGDEAFRRERAALDRLTTNVDIKRVARTYVVGIGYTSPDPVRAADIANAFAEAYLADQLNSRFEATRRASVWLQDRIAELRAQATAADLAVQAYRKQNNLVETDGKLVSDQQMSEVSTQLIAARADTAQAQARYKQIKEILDNHQTDAAVTESLGSTVISDLRSKYFDASKREAEIAAKLGPSHLQAVNLRNQKAEYERLIFEELGRIATTYESAYKIALTREEALTTSMNAFLGASSQTNQSMVQLRQLQQDADTSKALYQTFLQRYQEAVQQQSFPITDARIITRASPALEPAFPKKGLVIAAGLLLGGLAGAGLGGLREALDRGLRTGEQVREDLDVEFLGMLPALTGAGARAKAPRGRGAGKGAGKGAARTAPAGSSPFGTGAAGEAPVPGDAGPASGAVPLSRLLERVPPILRFVIEHPLSAYAETLRAVKVAMDLAIPAAAPAGGRPLGKVVGVVSVLPGEGKSTTSKNLATLLARQGTRTLLIDADLRSPGLTRALAPDSDTGLAEVLLEGRPVEAVAMLEADSDLVFLPAATRRRVTHTGDMLASPAMRQLLDRACERFDVVVLDLPPLGAVIDARAAAPLVDGFVFVAEWGKTARRAVRNTLATNPVITEKLLGLALNKVDMKKLRTYENFGTTEYYYRKYQKYYR